MSENSSVDTSQVLPGDPKRHFSTDHLTNDLGGRTARGGFVTIISQGLKFLLGIVATIVLARLLTPQDYGLIGMVAVVIGFVSMFKDLGLAAATIQRKEISAEQVSTLFWVNIAASVTVMALTAAIAPAVARFYAEPRLTWITIGFAGGFLFGGLTVQHEALLRREMRFVALAVTEIVSLVVGITTAVVLAVYGAGYWALVLNQLVSGFVYAAGVWIACDWRPGWPVRYSGVRSMLEFGRNLTGFSIVNYFARTLDNLLIGKFWGSQELGLYAKAYQLLILPIEQINTPIAAVAIPALSRLADSPERYRHAYLRILEKVAILTMPGIALMIATSDWIVKIVLGPQWSDSARIFAFLGIAGLLQPVINTTGWLFITQARTGHMFQWGLIGGTLIMISIVAGLPWGATGVAVSYSMVFVLVLVPTLFWFVGRSGPVQALDFYRTIGPFAAASACSLLACLLFRRLTGVGAAAGLGGCLLITICLNLLILALIPSGRLALFDLKKSAWLLMRKRE